MKGIADWGCCWHLVDWYIPRVSTIPSTYTIFDNWQRFFFWLLFSSFVHLPNRIIMHTISCRQHVIAVYWMESIFWWIGCDDAVHFSKFCIENDTNASNWNLLDLFGWIKNRCCLFDPYLVSSIVPFNVQHINIFWLVKKGQWQHQRKNGVNDKHSQIRWYWKMPCQGKKNYFQANHISHSACKFIHETFALAQFSDRFRKKKPKMSHSRFD